MREHRYRAWHKLTHRMFSVSGMSYSNTDGSLQKICVSTLVGKVQRTLECFPLAEIELMQFTSLMDKHGTPVYEGDIVFAHGYGFKLIVKWCDGKGENLGNQVGWWLDDGYYMLEFEAYQWVDDDHEYANVTVLGNIYEHPALLKDVGSMGYDPLTREQRRHV